MTTSPLPASDQDQGLDLDDLHARARRMAAALCYHLPGHEACERANNIAAALVFRGDVAYVSQVARSALTSPILGRRPQNLTRAIWDVCLAWYCDTAEMFQEAS